MTDQARNQSSIFLEIEGDSWFERNKAALAARGQHHEVETMKRVLLPFADNIHRILEIGCGDGAKLHELCRQFGAEGSGIDPSAAAVEHGGRAYPALNLAVGTAASLPHANESFDLVVFGFCLYLVDRADVMKAVAEADRVLKSGGFLAIVDFDPKLRHKRPYHHRPGLFSYKNSHADFFTAGGHYYLVAKESFSHAARHFATDSDERVSMCILYKEPESY